MLRVNIFQNILKAGFLPLVLCVIVFGLSSCSTKPLYDETRIISDQGWKYDSTLNYTYSIDDTSGVYYLLIKLNTEEDYKYQNLWMFINTEAPSGIIHKDTVQAILSNSQGEMLGDKTLFEPQYVTNQAYKIKYKFSELGGYNVGIQQGMRDSIINGIDEVSLMLYK